MVIEEALYAYLSTEAGTALLAGTRGYPLSIPQDIALPAWAYQRVSGERLEGHAAPLGYAAARFQITCQGDSYSAAKGLKEAIRSALEGYHGVMGGVSGVTVHAAFIRSELDGYGMTGGIYTCRIDVEIYYRE